MRDYSLIRRQHLLRRVERAGGGATLKMLCGNGQSPRRRERCLLAIKDIVALGHVLRSKIIRGRGRPMEVLVLTPKGREWLRDTAAPPLDELTRELNANQARK